MFYRFCWFLAFLPFKLFYNIKIIGKKNFIKKGRCVGICNHYSLGDVPNVAIRFFRQFHFICKKELCRTKGSAWLLRHLGAIPIDRDAVDLSATKAALKTLKDEQLLMIFPEGTRNKTGENVQSVKAGAAIFSIKGKAPIVPMVLYKKPRVFRKNYLLIGEPFELSEYYGKKMTPDDIEASGNIIFKKLSDLHDELNGIVDAKKSKRNNKNKQSKKGESNAAETSGQSCEVGENADN